MEVSLILIAPAGEKQHARMGTVCDTSPQLAKTFERHALVVKGHKTFDGQNDNSMCVHPGCGESAMNGPKRPHRWTCFDHDPLIVKKKAA